MNHTADLKLESNRNVRFTRENSVVTKYKIKIFIRNNVSIWVSGYVFKQF